MGVSRSCSAHRFFPAKGDITTLTFKATYNDAGKVIAYKVHNIPIDSKSKKALELLELAEKVIGKLDIDKASDFVKAVAIHDYIVQNSKYDEEMSRSSYTAHGVLSSGLAFCLGYAETAGMLLSLAGVENRFVWAKSKMTASGTHGFIKLVLGKEWWNLDCTVDDPMPDRANVVRHDFCLVTDDVAAQRYSWDKNRYPASPKGKRNLWYEKADRVVKTQKSL